MLWLEEEGGAFPHPIDTEEEVIALTEGLRISRLISAYQHGIFPWYSDGQPVLWWFPKERAVLFPDKLKVHKSMRTLLRKSPFDLSFNKSFEEVIFACSNIPRKHQGGTWITQEMIEAYITLHRLGWAHSVEVWQGNALVGGLYGVMVGRVFCGESMFSRISNASKYALIHLVQHLTPKGLQCIDVQQDTDHLRSMGSQVLTDRVFFDFMRKNRQWSLAHGHLRL